MGVRGGHGGAAQDPSRQRGGVKDPRRGPGPILEAAPQSGRAWAEPLRGTRELVAERFGLGNPQTRPQPRTKGAPGPWPHAPRQAPMGTARLRHPACAALTRGPPHGNGRGVALEPGPAPTYAALASELGLTASEAHAAVERAVAARLAIADEAGEPSVVRAALRAFVQHGARYCFPSTQGDSAAGVPPATPPPPLNEQIRPGHDPPPVWPSKKGTARGSAFHPLYPSVPEAAERNPALGELLALFDAVRGASAREQALALALLEERLQP
jgi:hypothetical protein